ncbi:host attachment family protein [Flavisphingomonas formosensis]|uniref:host attachment family protein n=1 Tax=Flavisphingomonas formosensis TaxID=861534 RepID=UPI0012F87EA1|nr:host attachment family protein [Sphingomonas formosensis]
MHLAHDGVVAVTDGRKLLLLRNHGDEKMLDLRVETHRVQDNPPDREQGSDRSGRSMNSVGSHRGAMEETDFHQLEEDRFAAATVDLLNRRALEDDFSALLVIAPPNTLGEMRKHYHKALQGRIVGELDKDLANQPVPEIERIVGQS